MSLHRFKNIHHDLQADANPVGDAFLKQVLKAEPGALKDTRGLIPLPPIGDRLPMLHLVHGIENGREMLRMTVAIIGKDGEEPVATAWRFECPEGPGEHCYWHCQPVRELRTAQILPALGRLPGWYFHDMPTLPMPARDADELLICMLLSIYGYRALDEMQREGFADQLGPRLRELAAA